MQTFVPYNDFAQCAQTLDYKRLGKQRVECKQILNALIQGPQIAFEYVVSPSGRRLKKSLWFQPLDSGDGIKNTPWYNHPATQMWIGHEYQLIEYSIAICKEWQKRGYNDSLLEHFKSLQSNYQDTGLPSWWSGDIHSSHRSNLLRKDEYYNQFDWSEQPGLPYVWPEATQ